MVFLLIEDSVQIRFESPDALRQEFEKNISKRGIFVESEAAFEVRQPIDVEIILDYAPPGATNSESTDAASEVSNVAMTLRGEVVHCVPVAMAANGAKPGVAIQFDAGARLLCESFAPLLEQAAAATSGAAPKAGCVEGASPTQGAGATEGLKTSASGAPEDASPSLDLGQTDAATRVGPERRGAKREAVRVPVRIMPTMSPPFEATSRDLSASGILLTARTVALPIGEVVRTCLWHPSGEPSIEIDGKVVRGIKNKTGRIAAVAIAFDRHQAADPQTRDVIDALRHAGHRSRLGGISGSIIDLGLANMLQMFGASAPAGTLVVERDGEQGWIAFAKRQFLSAELGALVGRDALMVMLDWGEGRFHFEATVDEKIVATAVPQPLDAVVLEAVCAPDERDRSDSEPDVGETCVVDASTTFIVDLKQEERFRSSFGKTEDAVLELAKSGMATGKLKEIIPEPADAIQDALEGLVERRVLILR